MSKYLALLCLFCGVAAAQVHPIITPGTNIINLKDFGAACNGTTDDTAALNAALAAVYAANGGTIVVPNATCLIAGQITIPNNNTAVPGSPSDPYSRQPNIRITGSGDVRNGQGQLPGGGFGGSVLELTYAGTGYKIQTFGLGSLELDHVTFWDPTGDSTPFFLTTGTTVNIHDTSWIGSKSGNTANQDVLTLGGTLATGFTLNSPTAAFQGYDSVIENNYFNYIRRAVYELTYTASTAIENNFIGPQSGSNLTGGAAMEFDGTAVGANTVGNKIIDNRCEITGYYYCMKFLASQNNYIAGTDVEDALNSFNTSVYYFDAASSGNFVLINEAPSSGGMTDLTHVTDLTVNASYVAGQNTIIDSTQNAPSTFGYDGPVKAGTFEAPGGFYALPNALAATSSANYAALGVYLNSYYWNGTSSATDSWQIFPYLPNGTNPSSTLEFLHTGSPGTAQVWIPGGLVVGSASQINIDANGNFNIGSGLYLNSSSINTDNLNPRNAGDMMNIGSGGSATIIAFRSPFMSLGTVFSIASGTGACSTTGSIVGGAQAGSFSCTGTTGASTVTLTLAAAQDAYSCWGRDVTTPTTVTQTGAVSATSVTLTLASVATNDTVQFGCLGY